ncbi:MAG: PhoU domain-containing protein, partial [Bacteroidota bacterium]
DGVPGVCDAVVQLERIGDIAVNFAERVRPLLPYRAFVQGTGIEDMAMGARQMVRDAIDAFVHNDVQLARRVLEQDDRIDEMDGHMFSTMLAKMKQSPENVEPAAHMMIVSRHVERLADHATNVAEDVIFLVNAKIVKHHADKT